MGKKAIIYCRVSTTDQAKLGFSLNNQEQQLKEYCSYKGYEVTAVFREDFTGTSFDRPKYNEAIEYCKRNKIDVFVVMKWDRFGRTLTGSIEQLARLKKLGIEMDCKERNFDGHNPEDFLIQTLLLAIPEVETKKIKQRTAEGIRRAFVEGRWPQGAPVGYDNYRELGKAYIRPSNDSNLVKEALTLFATGRYEREELRELMREKGLKLSRSQWPNFLSNPLYAGWVIVPIDKTTGEDSYSVRGQHEALIEEETYQAILRRMEETSKKNPKKKRMFQPLLPLRGSLSCPKCGGRLTGSLSKGTYPYYHCRNRCKFRIRAEVVDKSILTMFKSYSVSQKNLKKHESNVEAVFKEKGKSKQQSIRNLKQEVQSLNQRIIDLDDKLMDGKLSDENYNRMTMRLSEQLSSKKEELIAKESQETDYSKYTHTGLNLLENLPYYFKHASPKLKAKIVSSIFPENVIPTKEGCRTPRINELIRLVWDVGGDKTTKTNQINSDSSSSVAGTGLEPVTFGL